MKPLLLAGALVALLAGSSCRSSDVLEYNHWKSWYHPPVFASQWNRMEYHLLSYRPEMDGPYYSHFWNEMTDIGRTIQRHVLLDNPDNPFLREYSSGSIDVGDYDLPEWEGLSSSSR